MNKKKEKKKRRRRIKIKRRSIKKRGKIKNI
jgi:hypothetical protein